MNSSFCVLAVLKITCAAQTLQPFLPPLLFRPVTQLTLCPLCQNLPRMHCPIWMESRLHFCLCRWERYEDGSGQEMKTSKKCDNSNMNLYFTPRQNDFDEYHQMQSMLIDTRNISPDSIWGICDLTVDQSVDPNSVTSKDINNHLSVPLPICLGSYTLTSLFHQYCLKNVAFIHMWTISMQIWSNVSVYCTIII